MAMRAQWTHWSAIPARAVLVVRTVRSASVWVVTVAAHWVARLPSIPIVHLLVVMESWSSVRPVMVTVQHPVMTTTAVQSISRPALSIIAALHVVSLRSPCASMMMAVAPLVAVRSMTQIVQ